MTQRSWLWGYCSRPGGEAQELTRPGAASAAQELHNRPNVIDESRSCRAVEVSRA